MPDGPFIEAHAIVRRFGHVHALQGVEFDVGRGEIVGLIGDNGAGKSTLIRILSGADRPDGGEILVNGRPTHFNGRRMRALSASRRSIRICPWRPTWTRPRTCFWGASSSSRVFSVGSESWIKPGWRVERARAWPGWV